MVAKRRSSALPPKSPKFGSQAKDGRKKIRIEGIKYQMDRQSLRALHF